MNSADTYISIYTTGSALFDILFLDTLSMSDDSAVVIPVRNPAISELDIVLGKEKTLLHGPKMEIMENHFVDK